MQRSSTPEYTAKYFPEYGIHSVENGESTDHIVSFNNWDDTEDALKNNLPSSGRIITPEYATAPDDFTDLTRNSALIRDRIDFAKDLTRQTDAEILLGTPYEVAKGQWHNSVLTLQHGETVSVAHKTLLLSAERKAGITRPRTRARAIRNGKAVLICAELYDYPDQADALFRTLTEDVAASTMWQYRDEDSLPLTPQAIEKAGGEYNYYRQALEMTVGRYLLPYLPRVKRVTVADRGKPGSAPMNAVFERKDTQA